MSHKLRRYLQFISHKWLSSSIYKELLKNTKKATEEPAENYVKDMNKHFMEEATEICSTLLVIREMHIETIENYHFMQTTLRKVKKAGKFRSWRNSPTLLLGANTGKGTWENNLPLSCKVAHTP